MQTFHELPTLKPFNEASQLNTRPELFAGAPIETNISPAFNIHSHDDFADVSPHLTRLIEKIVGAVINSDRGLSIYTQLSPEILPPGQLKEIYSAARSLGTEYVSLDSVEARMVERGVYDGTTTALLNRCVSVAAHPSEEVTIIAEIKKEGRRRLFTRVLADSSENIRDEQKLPDEVIAEMYRDLDELTSQVSEVKSNQQAIEEALERYNTPDRALRSGVPHLDDALNGLKPGTNTIISAATGVGKSIFAGDIIRRNCFVDGVPTLLITLEMDAPAYMNRLISAQASIPASDIEDGCLEGNELARYQAFAYDYGDAPLWIADDFELTLESIVAEIRMRVARDGVRLVVVDYLGLVEVESMRQASEYERVSYVSRTLTRLAADLDIVLISVAQQNRQGSTGTQVSTLKGSSGLEQDASNVILLDRLDPKEYGDTIRIRVGKTRFGKGAGAEITVDAEYPYQRFGIMQNAGWRIDESRGPEILELIRQARKSKGEPPSAEFFANSRFGVHDPELNTHLNEENAGE